MDVKRSERSGIFLAIALRQARSKARSRSGYAFPRLGVIWADGKYHSHNLYAWIEENADYRLHIVSRPAAAKGFVLLPKRWVAERTLAWLGRSRRLCKDYEVLTETSEAMIIMSAIHMMVKRLAPSGNQPVFRYRTNPRRAA